MSQIFPVADFNALVRQFETLPRFKDEFGAAAMERQANLTKPLGSLGRLEELVQFMAGWQGNARPAISRAQCLIFAGNHGICAQKVNPYPQEVTKQMVQNFRNGGASINQFCRLFGAELQVIELDLDNPTQDFSQTPAMTEAEVLAAMEIGAKSVDPNAQVVLLGEMGIGNSTIAAALSAALFGGDPALWVGPGTGSNAQQRAHKAAVIAAGLALHKDLINTCFGPLLAFGGREQAAICGAIIAARSYSIPVMLDGFICCSAAALLQPYGLLDHCLVGHSGAEPGHARLLNALDKKALLDLGLCLGEGSGAAVALGILRAALEMHNGMATFAEAGVTSA